MNIKGSDLNPNDFDKEQVSVGVLVELEHTDDKTIAQNIALTHLKENPKYYSDGFECGLFDEKSAAELAKEYGWIVKESKRIKRFKEYSDLNEAMARENSIKQLQKVMKLSAKTDIGNRTKMSGGNLHFDHNPIDTVESYEDFEKNNKSFITGWNNKNLISPFK